MNRPDNRLLDAFFRQIHLDVAKETNDIPSLHTPVDLQNRFIHVKRKMPGSDYDKIFHSATSTLSHSEMLVMALRDASMESKRRISVPMA